jgi:molybdopterin/thiamine biosynthesis adenylyltransferase
MRYKNNTGTYLSEENQKELLNKTFAVIGLGGNGGYIAEFLVRQGCKKLILIDFDTFEESNLNRQLFCTEHNLYLNKAEQAYLRLKEINSLIDYEYYCFPHGTQEIPSLYKCDMIFAAADANQYTLQHRSSLRTLICAGIPLVEGCVWDYGVQVGIITNEYLDLFDSDTKHWERMNYDNIQISQPAWICAIAAALAVEECYKYFFEEDALIGQKLIYDIRENMLHRLVNHKFIY